MKQKCCKCNRTNEYFRIYRENKKLWCIRHLSEHHANENPSEVWGYKVKNLEIKKRTKKDKILDLEHDINFCNRIIKEVIVDLNNNNKQQLASLRKEKHDYVMELKKLEKTG